MPPDFFFFLEQFLKDALDNALRQCLTATG